MLSVARRNLQIRKRLAFQSEYLLSPMVTNDEMPALPSHHVHGGP